MPQPRRARLKNTLCFDTFIGEQKDKSRIRESKKMIRKVRKSTHLADGRCLGAQHIVSRQRKDDEAYARPRQVPVHLVKSFFRKNDPRPDVIERRRFHDVFENSS